MPQPGFPPGLKVVLRQRRLCDLSDWVMGIAARQPGEGCHPHFE